jgi:hypothetical protein
MSGLGQLRNVGKATLGDFRLLGITTVEQLAGQDAGALYRRLCQLTRQRQDPCVHDVFAAAIHQAKTGEALDWWAFTARRKAREGVLSDSDEGAAEAIRRSAELDADPCAGVSDAEFRASVRAARLR